MNNRYSNSLILMGIIVFTFLSGSAYTEDISNEKEIQKHVQGKVELEIIPLNRSVKIVKNNKFNIPRIFLAGDGRKICEFWGGRLLSRADIYFYFKNKGDSGYSNFDIVIEYYKTLPGKLTSRKFPFSKNIFKIEKTQRYAIAVHITNLKPSPRKKYGSSEVTGFPSPEFTVKLKSAEKLIDVFSMDLPLMYPIVYDLSLFELTDQMKLIPLGTYRKLYLEMQKKTQ